MPETRAPSRTRPWLTLIAAPVLLLAALAVFLSAQMRQQVLQHAVNEGRTVADMVENVGRWAAQYGGVHARTVGANAAIPGNFLTRSVYAYSGSDSTVLTGVSTKSAGAEQERAALSRMEAYHWKNPALVQREVADVVAQSGSRARFRLTAASVLNPINTPNAFESEALAQLKDGQRKEWWTVRGGELMYARTVLAQKSCLTCHASAQTAPAFIRENSQFNGGGGFGYQEGQPAGVIAVTLPMRSSAQAWALHFDALSWAALAILLAAIGWICAALWRR